MTTSRRIGGSFLITALLVILGGRFPIRAQKPPTDPPASQSQPDTAAKGQSGSAAKTHSSEAAHYVGSDTCKGCHEELYNKFRPTPHSALLPEVAKKGPSFEVHGCESCHGPGSAHVEGGGDKSKIFSFKNLTPQEASGKCQQCHQAGDHSNFQRSSHLTNGIGCTSCHSVHTAKVGQALLQQDTPRLCYGCHTEQKAEFARPYRHRVNEGLIRCTDCHNEHGSFLPRQLRTSVAQDQVCYTCHSDKRGPFVFEHVPVKAEGCTSCHTPHGSTNPRLLKVSQVNTLCLQCHTLTVGPTPSQPPIGPAHNQSQKYQACTMCHAFVHGSNTSEVYFKP